MAQRMESVAPPGGVMLSESTARLVEDATVLGEPEKVHIKGSDSPVIGRRLVAQAAETRPRRQLSTLVGRDWELSAIAGILDQAVSGRGRVVGLVGPPGIGKSRLVLEAASIATERGVEVFTTYCESHTSDIPFHVATRLLREVLSISGLDDDEARVTIRSRMPDAEPEDLMLLDDLLGVSDPGVSLPHRSGCTDAATHGSVECGAIARTSPAFSLSRMRTGSIRPVRRCSRDFAAVVPQTHVLILVTYRPEYRGALDQSPSSHRIPLTPLRDSDATTLVTELLGSDPSVTPFVAQVAERAAGNPLFAEEIVRDFAERGVVAGEAGAFVSQHDRRERAGARIAAVRYCRPHRPARPSSEAHVECRGGHRIALHLRTARRLGGRHRATRIGPKLNSSIRSGSSTETISPFRHPLIPYSGLRISTQVESAPELHRNLATGVEEQRSEILADANAALIAAHLEDGWRSQVRVEGAGTCVLRDRNRVPRCGRTVYDELAAGSRRCRPPSPQRARPVRDADSAANADLR